MRRDAKSMESLLYVFIIGDQLCIVFDNKSWSITSRCMLLLVTRT